jgi:hypothetical protein
VIRNGNSSVTSTRHKELLSDIGVEVEEVASFLDSATLHPGYSIQLLVGIDHSSRQLS